MMIKRIARIDVELVGEERIPVIGDLFTTVKEHLVINAPVGYAYFFSLNQARIVLENAEAENASLLEAVQNVRFWSVIRRSQGVTEFSSPDGSLRVTLGWVERPGLPNQPQLCGSTRTE